MRPHSFNVGQTVQIHASKQERNLPSGMYTVMRLQPNDGTDREYRVRSQSDGHERIVRESQFSGMSEVWPFWPLPTSQTGTRPETAPIREGSVRQFITTVRKEP